MATKKQLIRKLNKVATVAIILALCFFFFKLGSAYGSEVKTEKLLNKVKDFCGRSTWINSVSRLDLSYSINSKNY